MMTALVKIPILTLLATLFSGIAVLFHIYFLIIKIKSNVKAQNKKKKHVHHQPGRNPSLNSNPESFKNQNQNH